MREAKIKIKFSDEQYKLVMSILETLELASEKYDAYYKSDHQTVRRVKGARPLWGNEDAN